MTIRGSIFLTNTLSKWTLSEAWRESAHSLPPYVPVRVYELVRITCYLLRSCQPHEEIYSAIRRRGIPFEIIREFDVQGVFRGAAVSVSVCIKPEYFLPPVSQQPTEN